MARLTVNHRAYRRLTFRSRGNGDGFIREGTLGHQGLFMTAALRRNAHYVTLVLGLLVGLIMAEGMLRLVMPAFTQFYVWPPRTRYVFHPLPTIMPGIEGPSRFTVGDQGFRGRSFNPSDQQQFRILAIGGSTTECLYLDDAEAWPSITEELLGKIPRGRPIWVGNGGKSGLNSRDHIFQVKHLLAQYPQIDVVLILVGVNDLLARLKTDNYSPAFPPLSSRDAEIEHLKRAFSISPSSAWYEKTATYYLLRGVKVALFSKGLIQDNSGMIYDTWRAHRRSAATILDEMPDLTSALEEYERNLNTIIDLVHARERRVVFLTQPVLWRSDLGSDGERLLWLGGKGDFQKEPGKPYYSARVLAQGMDLYNQRLLRICEFRKINCIDLEKKIPKTTEMFFDDAHFTEKGAQVMAQVVSEHLAHHESFSSVARVTDPE